MDQECNTGVLADPASLFTAPKLLHSLLSNAIMGNEQSHMLEKIAESSNCMLAVSAVGHVKAVAKRLLQLIETK